MSWTLGNNPVGDLEYSYDADGRVIEKTGSFAQTGLPQAVTGNMFNAANEMTAFNGTPQTYDANGNLTNDGTSTYNWDARNHLTAIAGPNAASFAYDADGRRAQKTVNSTSTQFLYDGLNPVQELQSGAPGANMLTGLGIDEYFQRSDGSGPSSYISDPLGSTLALTDLSGTIQTQYSYDPFGNTTLTGVSSSNPYQFTGRENDGAGLYFYRARYYSPTLQGFMAQDPIDFLGGIDLYAYVANDPTNFTDPMGEFPFRDCGKAIRNLAAAVASLGNRCGDYFAANCDPGQHKKSIRENWKRVWNAYRAALNACGPDAAELAEIKAMMDQLFEDCQQFIENPPPP